MKNWIIYSFIETEPLWRQAIAFEKDLLNTSLYWWYTPINFSIGHNAWFKTSPTCYSSMVLNQLQFYGPKSDPGFGVMWWPPESATYPGISISSLPFRKHMALSAMCIPKSPPIQGHKLEWRTTLCITPHCQIVPYRMFYSLEFISSRNFMLPEINRTMQPFLPYMLYTIYSVHSILR